MTQRKDTAGIENSYQGNGLNDTDLQARRKQYGYNEIPKKQAGPVAGTLKRMWGPIPWLLEAAMIFELFLGKGVQAAVVFLLLVFSAVVGEIQEKRAKNAIGYLHSQLQISVRVLRNGRPRMGNGCGSFPIYHNIADRHTSCHADLGWPEGLVLQGDRHFRNGAALPGAVIKFSGSYGNRSSYMV